MDDEIDAAPFLPDSLEYGVDGRGIGDVAMAEQQAVELPGERLDAFLQRVALPGQRDLRAGRAGGPGNAPGNRTVIGDAENHAALAPHQVRTIAHSVSCSVELASRRGTPALLSGTPQICTPRPPASCRVNGIVPSFRCYVVRGVRLCRV